MNYKAVQKQIVQATGSFFHSPNGEQLDEMVWMVLSGDDDVAGAVDCFLAGELHTS